MPKNRAQNGACGRSDDMDDMDDRLQSVKEQSAKISFVLTIFQFTNDTF